MRNKEILRKKILESFPMQIEDENFQKMGEEDKLQMLLPEIEGTRVAGVSTKAFRELLNFLKRVKTKPGGASLKDAMYIKNLESAGKLPTETAESILDKMGWSLIKGREGNLPLKDI